MHKLFSYKYSFSCSGKVLGQNLYFIAPYASTATPVNTEHVIQLWAVDEKPDYNYDTRACSGVCGHYTQVMKVSDMLCSSLHRAQTDHLFVFIMFCYVPHCVVSIFVIFLYKCCNMKMVQSVSALLGCNNHRKPPGQSERKLVENDGACVNGHVTRR